MITYPALTGLLSGKGVPSALNTWVDAAAGIGLSKDGRLRGRDNHRLGNRDRVSVLNHQLLSGVDGDIVGHHHVNLIPLVK